MEDKKMTTEQVKKEMIIDYYRDLFQPDPGNLLPLDEHIKRQDELLEDFYPGREKLTDDELLREKYYKSLHTFQQAIAQKRFIEFSKAGMISGETSYEFNYFGKGI